MGDKKKFELPDLIAPELSKPFIVGVHKPQGLHDNLKLVPIFSFTDANLNGTSLCYNNPELKVEHYHKLFERLKNIGRKTYNELNKEGKYWRFHDVDFEEKNVSLSKEDFKKAISRNPDKVSDEGIPTCYQFDVAQEMRAMGYLGHFGIFYLVWFDKNHEVYS